MGLIAIGVAVQVVLKQAITHETSAGSLLPVVMIAVGAFLFLVAFVGCCGACKENYCLMITVSGVWELLGLPEGVSVVRWVDGEHQECLRN